MNSLQTLARTAATVVAALALLIACGSPMSAASMSKPAVLSVRKNSSMIQRKR